ERVGVDGDVLDVELDRGTRGARETEEVPSEAVADVHQRGGALREEPDSVGDARTDAQVTAEQAAADGAGEEDGVAGARAVAAGGRVGGGECADGGDGETRGAGTGAEVAADEVAVEGAGHRSHAGDRVLEPALRSVGGDVESEEDGEGAGRGRGEVGQR